MALFATAVTTSSKVIAFRTAIYRQGQNSSGFGRFRPGPPSETEKLLPSRWEFCLCGLVTGCF